MWPELLGRTSNDSEFHAESNEPFRSQIQCVLFGEIDLMPLLKQTSPVWTANMHSINHETWASSSGKTDKEHLFTTPIRYYCWFHSRVQVLFWKLKSCVKSIFVEILSHLNGHKRASLIFNLKGGFESTQNSPNICTRQLSVR